LLADSGKFSLILPFSQQENSDQYAEKNSFYKTRILKIIPKPKKPANRILLEFQLNASRPVREKTLLIRDENNNYTPEYKILTKEFYLNF
jgi:tRNA1Val (adenine37-N6)-methyltransferase